MCAPTIEFHATYRHTFHPDFLIESMAKLMCNVMLIRGGLRGDFTHELLVGSVRTYALDPITPMVHLLIQAHHLGRCINMSGRQF
jgi:hypothetical protein